MPFHFLLSPLSAHARFAFYCEGNGKVHSRHSLQNFIFIRDFNGERRRIQIESSQQQTIRDYPSEVPFENRARALAANKSIVVFIATSTLVTTSRRDNNHEQNGSVLSVISQNTNFCCHKISCQCLLCVPFSYTFDVFNCFA